MYYYDSSFFINAICGLTGYQEKKPSEVAPVNDPDIPDTPGM